MLDYLQVGRISVKQIEKVCVCVCTVQLMDNDY